MVLKLDIGSGDYPHSQYGGGSGWTTVDLYKPADVKADMGTLPYADGEVDEIFSSHALEHCGRKDKARAVLKEWHRVLRPDGKLTLIVPNLDYSAKYWLEHPEDPSALALLFGMHDHAGEVHTTGWNERTLRRDLHDSGFAIEQLRIIDNHSQESLLAICSKTKDAPSESDLQSSIYRNSGDTVLVACPTYKGKSYSLDAYIRAYNAFTYPHRGIFMVDNTATGLDYFEHLKSLNVPCDHIDPTSIFQDTFVMCWKRIARYASDNGYKWVASIEQDNICPPIALDALLNVAGYCRALHVAHSYPWHKTQSSQGYLTGLGCNLISTEILVAIFNQETWFTNAIESEIYEYPKLKKFPTVELHNLFQVIHLDDDKAAEYYHFSRESLPKFGSAAAEWQPPKYNKDEAVVSP